MRFDRCLCLAVRLLTLAFGGATLGRGAATEQLPAIDEKWRHVRSANFEIFSRNPESEARDVLHHLELLRAVFFERFNFVERARLPVTVYAFRSEEDFRAYAPESFRSKEARFRGYYYNRPDRAVIALAPIEDWERSQVLVFHEYVHHLMRASETHPPAWFNEGMAELLASMRVVGETLEIGHPHPGRIYALREASKLTPLESLFATDYTSPVFRAADHTGLFYSESWALLHYWYFGDSGLSPDAVRRFLRVAGEKNTAAKVNLRGFFQECFGMDYPEMQKRLERYVESGRYRYGRQPAPKIPEAKTYAARAVPRDEIRLRLADLALRVTREPAAKFVLVDALAKAETAGSPIDARVFETLGMDAMVEGDSQRAKERWEQALAAGSTNEAIGRELGLLESREWFQRFDFYFRLPDDTADRLRTRLRRSIEHEPAQSAAYEMLAWVEAFSNEPQIANVNLVQQHFKQLRERNRTLLALAFVRVRLNRSDEAKELLAALEAGQPEPWTANAAEIVRAKLDGAREPVIVPNPGRAEAPRIKPKAPPLKVPSLDIPPPK